MFGCVAGKLAEITEQFYKAVVYYVYRPFISVNVPEYNLQGIAIVSLVQQFLVLCLVGGTSFYYGGNWFQLSKLFSFMYYEYAILQQGLPGRYVFYAFC